MIKRVAIMILLLCAVVSCSKDDEDIVVDYESKQILLMYYSGTNLKSNYNNNISKTEEAISLGALGDYGALYYFLPSTATKGTLYELTLEKGVCKEREVMSFEDFNSLEPESLTTVINAVKSSEGLLNSSEREINLVFSGHGSGWVLSSNTKAMDTAFLSSSYSNQSGVEILQTRCLGESAVGLMDISQLCEAIEDSNTHFGYILFDSCLMSSIEVLYRLRNLCDYIVASPAEVMSAGFPYDDVIPMLFKSNGSSFDLEGVCSAYYNYYDNLSSNNYAAVALCVTEELDALAQSLAMVTRSTLTSSERSSLQKYDNISSSVFFDLGNYIEVAGASDSDLSAFQTQFEMAFPSNYKFHTEWCYGNYGDYSDTYPINYYSGVSTSEPCINTTYNTGWSDEPWAIASTAQ